MEDALIHEGTISTVERAYVVRVKRKFPYSCVRTTMILGSCISFIGIKYVPGNERVGHVPDRHSCGMA